MVKVLKEIPDLSGDDLDPRLTDDILAGRLGLDTFRCLDLYTESEDRHT